MTVTNPQATYFIDLDPDQYKIYNIVGTANYNFSIINSDSDARRELLVELACREFTAAASNVIAESVFVDDPKKAIRLSKLDVNYLFKAHDFHENWWFFNELIRRGYGDHRHAIMPLLTRNDIHARSLLQAILERRRIMLDVSDAMNIVKSDDPKYRHPAVITLFEKVLENLYQQGDTFQTALTYMLREATPSLICALEKTLEDGRIIAEISVHEIGTYQPSNSTLKSYLFLDQFGAANTVLALFDSQDRPIVVVGGPTAPKDVIDGVVDLEAKLNATAIYNPEYVKRLVSEITADLSDIYRAQEGPEAIGLQAITTND